ncbi:hypothetical protein [Streptomyces sp. CB01881]|uniref:hypothetical protein n=1 Tax=Streptomyces sp. CB01881 TaxID=2078691 RepID=UPI000CDBEFAE|nr:hypothetical protein [Streptomyces sp. CB01881]AUY48065.1 hypothetical protein C2142_02755 [Streptomyces sp. CB01881]TYC76549.1 hypothetical protein EH183_02765 [Streptomyces sp. CB01881]
MPHDVEAFVVCSPTSHHHDFANPPSSLPLFHGTADSLKSCPSGTVTGGGGFAVGTSIYQSSPWGNGWLASAVNESAGHPELRAVVVCRD